MDTANTRYDKEYLPTLFGVKLNKEHEKGKEKKENFVRFLNINIVKEKFKDNHKNLKVINLYTWNALNTKKDPRQRQCISTGF